MTEYEKFTKSNEYEKWRMAETLHIYPEHVVLIYLFGTYEQNSQNFKKTQEQFPSLRYGTYVVKKRQEDCGNETWTIQRFVSKEINQMYCTWPPYYIRNGGKIL